MEFEFLIQAEDETYFTMDLDEKESRILADFVHKANEKREDCGAFLIMRKANQ
jgi:hypothetical protein